MLKRHLLIAIAVSTLAVAGQSTTQGVAWAIFVDDLHLDFFNTGRHRDVLRAIVKHVVGPDDVVAIRSSGPSTISLDFTAERSAIDGAIKTVAGNALRLEEILLLSAQTRAFDEVRYRALVAMSSACELLHLLETVEHRRKALVYVSNGYQFEIEGDRGDSVGCVAPAAMLPADRRELMLRIDATDATLRQQFSEVTAMANRVGARIFAIDGRVFPGVVTPLEDVDPAIWSRYLLVTQPKLRTLAERTDGIALLEARYMPYALAEIRDRVRE